jgi:hypothetical protein
MRQLHIRPVLFYSLTLLVMASLLVACSQDNVVPPPEKIVTASGLVLDMPLGTPLADATVQLISNEFFIDDPRFVRTCECEGYLCDVWTTSDAEGYWEMDVPVKYDENLAPLNMLMKVSKGTTPPQYNLFQPGGTNQGDLQLLSSAFYDLFALTSGTSLLDLILGQAAVFLGVSIGFAEVGYPGEVVMIPGVTVTAEAGDPAEERPMVYLGESGLPDTGLTATSPIGVFYFSVPNANDDVAPSVQLEGDKPGSVFVGGFYPACPGSSTGVAVIDPYYQP